MIALLGARWAADPEIEGALRASLGVLYAHRGATGAIPNNVDCHTLIPNFRAYADGGLWWVVGNALFAPERETAREVLRWYEYQDVDQSGLLSMQESSDWQDLFCTRGKGLYLNCLYVLALRSAARLWSGAERGLLERKAAAVAERIREYFWYAGDGNLMRPLRHTFSTEGVPETDSLGGAAGRPKSAT